jgi:hypothetical protein
MSSFAPRRDLVEEFDSGIGEALRLVLTKMRVESGTVSTRELGYISVLLSKDRAMLESLRKRISIISHP